MVLFLVDAYEGLGKGDIYILDKCGKKLGGKDMFNRRGLPGDRLIAYTPQETKQDPSRHPYLS